MTEQKSTTMLGRCRLAMFLVCMALTNPAGLFGVAEAQVRIGLDIDPDIRTMQLEHPVEISFYVQDSEKFTEFRWEHEGPGRIEGDPSEFAILYVPPETVSEQAGKVVITLTATNRDGEKITQRIAFELSTPAPEGFLPVSAGTYAITPYLRRYLQFLDMKAVDIEQPFAIQAREVTVGDFRRYADSLSEDERAALGTRWLLDSDGKPYPDERPIDNVTWQEAAAYAAWLSAQSGQEFRLPTVAQWAAACVQYAGEERPVVNTNDFQPVSTLRGKTIDHLLGNLREWSADPCDAGMYQALGENYMTDLSQPDQLGKRHCIQQNERWNGIGLRLVQIVQ